MPEDYTTRDAASTLPDLLRFEGHSVRIEIDEHGEPWFCARDAGEVLAMGPSAVSMSAARLDDDERKSINSIDTHGGSAPLYVSESGLYAMLMRSRKPQAERFRRWIRQKVLPSIRKTGSFSVLSDAEKIVEALQIANRMAEEERQKRLAAETQVEKMRPAADFADRLTASGRAISLTDAARVGKVSRAALIDACLGRWLFREGSRWKGKKWHMGPLRAYATQTDDGTKRFTHVTTSAETGGRTQVKITFKGLCDALRLIPGKDAPDPVQLSIDFEEVAS